MNSKQLTQLAAAIGVATMMTACGGGSSSSGGGGTTVAEGGNGFVVFPAAESAGAIALRSATARAALPTEYLYKTDGTPAGTGKIVDDNNNGFEVGRFGSGYMAELNGKFYYAGKDSSGDVELWVTDGTSAGTERVAEIYANGNAQPHNMVPAAGKLFMNAVVDQFGRELVVFDPVSNGTVVLSTNINGNPTSNTSPESLTPVDDGLFFFDQDAGDIYFTDGTAAGTVKIATNNETITDPGSPLTKYPQLIGDDDWLGYNGKLLFTGRFNALDAETRLYELDQDGNIKEIAFDNNGFTVRLDITQNVVTSNGKVYFVADAGAIAPDLHIFEYDGSSVVRLTGSEGSRPYNDDLVGTSLGVFMYADPGSTPYLLRIDNTSGSAGSPAALFGSGDYSFSDVQAFSMVEANGTVFFAADTEGAGGSDFGTELWKTDGTSQGTELVKDINDTMAGAGSGPFTLTFMYQVPPSVNGDLGSKYLFSANNGSDGFEPWVSDGSEAGTTLLKDISVGAGSSVID